MRKALNQTACRQEILARLGRIRPETPRRWGRMSAPQMICHLRDCYLSVMGERPMEIPVRFGWLRAMKGLVLYMPHRWPHGVPTRPEFDQLDGAGTPPSDFECDLRALIEAICRFTAQPRLFAFRTHPMFGDMNEKDWMRWGYLHADHHLRQFGE
jgi:hypothetical protein